MKVGKHAVALVTLVGFIVSTMGTAHAWFGNSHRELARQAILWMLRSSNPHQRLAGAVIVSSGEGYRANAIGKRNWILSQEAKAVDYYRDLALRNEGDTPSDIIPKVSYDFQGEVYTKFNHLLLAGRCDAILPDGSAGCPEGMQLDGLSYDKYPIGSDDAKKVWLPDHDEYPGYLVSVDTSLGDGSELKISDLLTAKGKATVLRMQGTSMLQDFCKKELSKGADAGIGTLLTKWWGVLAVAVDPFLLLGMATYPLWKNAMVGHFAALCPHMLGVWNTTTDDSDEGGFNNGVIVTKTVYLSPAMAELGAVNHSKIQPSDVEGIGSSEVRWHPADNLAARGLARFIDTKAFGKKIADLWQDRSYEYFGKYELGDCTEQGRGRTQPKLTPPDRKDNDIGVKVFDSPEVIFKPRCSGYLTNLGSLLHAIGDVDNPGHTSGLLFAPEHEGLEAAVDAQVEQYNFIKETVTSKTGTIEEVYETRDKEGITTYELDWLLDTDAAETEIQTLLKTAIDENHSIEKLVEDAAIRRYGSLEDFRSRQNLPHDHPRALLTATGSKYKDSIAREFFTSALVNNVVGLTMAMRQYVNHGRSVSEDKKTAWDDATEKVTWTTQDTQLRKELGRPTPTFGETVEADLVKTEATSYSLAVDHYYQEYKLTGGCYVKNPNWCSDAIRDRSLGRPCPMNTDGTLAVTFCTQESSPPGCYHKGPPELLNASQVTGRMTLSRENRGGDDENIHVTGLYDNSSRFHSPAFAHLDKLIQTGKIQVAQLPEFPGTTRTSSENRMGIEYYNQSLNLSRGAVVKLDAGVLAAGVATWCTGPDVANSRNTEDNDRVLCEYEQVDYDASPCDDQERSLFENQKQVNKNLEKFKLPIPLPMAAAGRALSPGRQESIDTLALRYSTADTDLQDALAPATGKPVTLLDPSPYGRASFVWKDDKGLRNVATVLRSGNIVTTKTAK